MKTDSNHINFGIQFSSFIAINRYMDKQILKDSKLFNLMIYIALRVKRSNKTEANNWEGIKLEIGEFIIGRLSTVRETDLTEMEYRNRIEKLKRLKIITNFVSTNKYSKGKWLENSFIDINLEQSIIQQDNQQTTSGSTTNNNINNNNNPYLLSSIIISLNNGPYSNSDYERVIRAYMQSKGIELRGEEIKDTFFVVKKMFDSQRTANQIIQCMKWMKEHEDDERYPWLNSWTISTVQKKLPEFIAGKLKIRSWIDDIPKV